MLGIGVTLAYRLVKNNIIGGFKVRREYKILKIKNMLGNLQFLKLKPQA